MALLIDIGGLSDEQTDRALNLIYKSIHNHDDDDAIWDKHPSVFVRRLVELFTERGLMRLETFRKELFAWAQGERHRPAAMPKKPNGMMQRWTPSELKLVKLYLETLPPEQFTLDDWMMVVDYLVQRYLPENEMRTEAEWLAVRSELMGRVQANMENLDEKQADVIVAALPTTVATAEKAFTMSAIQQALIEYGNLRCAENVVKLTDAVRHRMRDVIMQHTEQQMLKIPGTPGQSLETRLFDEFATFNRDWRRIAVTEAGENLNQGYIASLQPGAKVKRIEQYRGACPWCRKIDGLVMDVVSPDAPDKDGETQVWVGKTNIGRSAAPRRRQAGTLIAREPHEMWWPAAGTQHPHCRGRWVPVANDEPGDDAEFAAWLKKHLKGKS